MTHTRKFRFLNKSAAFATLAALSLVVVIGCEKTTAPVDPPAAMTLRDSLIAEGEVTFNQSCVACHGHDGVGESAPPLLHSDYLIAQRMRPARILLMGLPNPIDSNPIVVNGIEHNNQMFAIATSNNWNDRKIAGVLTYVRAVLNDSTSTNCVVSENGDGQPVSNCTIVPSPADAISTITPEEIAALRDSLTEAGLLD